MEQSISKAYDQKAQNNAKLALAIRAGRSALGWNQATLAAKAGVAKTTVSRFENLELTIKADTFLSMLLALKQGGAVVDITTSDDIVVNLKHENWKKQGQEMWEKFYACDKNSPAYDDAPPEDAFIYGRDDVEQ